MNRVKQMKAFNESIKIFLILHIQQGGAPNSRVSHQPQEQCRQPVVRTSVVSRDSVSVYGANEKWFFSFRTPRFAFSDSLSNTGNEISNTSRPHNVCLLQVVLGLGFIHNGSFGSPRTHESQQDSESAPADTFFQCDTIAHVLFPV